MTAHDDEVAIAEAIAAEAITDATRAGIGFGIQVVDAYAQHFPEAAEHCDIIAATMRIKSISFEIKPQPSIDQPSVPVDAQTPVGGSVGTPERSETRTEAETGDTAIFICAACHEHLGDAPHHQVTKLAASHDCTATAEQKQAREDVARAMAQVLVPAVEWHDIPDLLKKLLGRCTDASLTAAAPHIANAIRTWADRMRENCIVHACIPDGKAFLVELDHDAGAIAATVCGERK